MLQAICCVTAPYKAGLSPCSNFSLYGAVNTAYALYPDGKSAIGADADDKLRAVLLETYQWYQVVFYGQFLRICLVVMSIIELLSC